MSFYPCSTPACAALCRAPTQHYVSWDEAERKAKREQMLQEVERLHRADPQMDMLAVYYVLRGITQVGGGRGGTNGGCVEGGRKRAGAKGGQRGRGGCRGVVLVGSGLRMPMLGAVQCHATPGGSGLASTTQDLAGGC